MSGYLLWPKSLPAEVVEPHLRADFHDLRPDQQDHAWVVAEIRALHPETDPRDVLRGEARALVGGGAALIALMTAAWLLLP